MNDYIERYRAEPLDLMVELSKDAAWQKFKLGRHRTTLFAAPQYVKPILNDSRIKRARYVRAMSHFIGNGLLVSEGDYHREHRRLMNPAFHPNTAPYWIAAIHQCLDQQTADWHDGETRDMLTEMARLSILLISQVLFNYDASRRADALIDIFRDGSRISVGRTIAPGSTWQGGRKPYNLLLNEVLDEIVAQPSAPHQLLTHLKNGIPSPQELRDEIVTCFIAGHETTFSTLTWTLYLLGRYPLEQQRMVQQIDECLDGRRPTYDDIQHLDAVKDVIREAIRLQAPVWVLGREATEPLEVMGIPIEKSEIVLLSPYAMHRDSRYFDHPECFTPLRFRKGIHEQAYFPFGGGPHTCIGQWLALVQLCAVITHIYQRYTLDLITTAQITAEALVALSPAGSLPMRIHHRQSVGTGRNC